MSLDAKIPEGDISQKWSNYKSKVHLVNPANKRNLEVVVVGSDLPVLPLLPHWQRWDTRSRCSAFRTVHVVHTPSLLKEVSMPPRIIRMTVIAITDYFMTLSRR